MILGKRVDYSHGPRGAAKGEGQMVTIVGNNGETVISLSEEEVSDVVLALMSESNGHQKAGRNYTSDLLWELAKRIRPVSSLTRTDKYAAIA